MHFYFVPLILSVALAIWILYRAFVTKDLKYRLKSLLAGVALICVWILISYRLDHAMYWGYASEDCYKRVKYDFSNNNTNYTEVETALLAYLDNSTYANSQSIELSAIDSIILDSTVVNHIKQFAKSRDIDAITLENDYVTFWYSSNCIADFYSDPTVFHSLALLRNRAPSDTSTFDFPVYREYHRKYRIIYKLSSRWYYRTNVKRW